MSEGEELTLLRIERERLLASIRYNSAQCTQVYERVVERTTQAINGHQGGEEAQEAEGAKP